MLSEARFFSSLFQFADDTPAISVPMLLRQVANVVSFGADPKGATDSTSAIAKAIATGKPVYFPTGNYISGPQAITSQGQTLFGDGAASVITQLAAGSHLFTVRATYVNFTDMRMNGVETSATNSNFAIFTEAANAAQFLNVERVIFSGQDGTKGFNNAIKLDDACNFGTVINCRIERLWGNVSGRGYGVLIGNAKGCRVTGNNMIATSGRGRHGVYPSGGASDCVVHGNYLQGFDQEGISQYSLGGQPACERNIYSSNTLVGCSASTNAYSGSIGLYGHSKSCVIANNTVSGSGQRGITVDGSAVSDCEDTIIVGNVVKYANTNGINVTAAVRGVISGNSVRDSGAAITGAYSNIMLRSDGTRNVSDFLITGNRCSGNTYTRAAIGFDPGPPLPTGIKMYGNLFSPGTLTTIEYNGVSVNTNPAD